MDKQRHGPIWWGLAQGEKGYDRIGLPAIGCKCRSNIFIYSGGCECMKNTKLRIVVAW